jgi:peptidoglycan/LPS O-acetylase OafA/YrhL
MHQNNFNLLRLIAASQVMIMHSWQHLKLPLHPVAVWLFQSFPGVPIFFVISGFLITQSWRDCHGKWMEFGRRRALRIFPGLWVNFLFILCLLYVGGAFAVNALGTYSFWEFQFWQFLLGSDFFGGYFAGSIYDWSGFYHRYPSGVLWTINAELGFYILAPLIILLTARHKSALILAFIAAFFFAWLNRHLRATLPPHNDLDAFTNSPFPTIWVFLLGMAAQLYWDKIKAFIEGRFVFWLCLYLIVSIALKLGFNVSANIYRSFPVHALIQIPLLGCCALSFAYSLRSIPIIRNDLSYGIYLYHMTVVWTLFGFGLRGEWWLWLLVPAATLTLAAMSWFLIERPALRLKRPVPRAAARLPEGAAGS